MIVMVSECTKSIPASIESIDKDDNRTKVKNGRLEEAVKNVKQKLLIDMRGMDFLHIYKEGNEVSVLEDF